MNRHFNHAGQTGQSSLYYIILYHNSPCNFIVSVEVWNRFQRSPFGDEGGSVFTCSISLPPTCSTNFDQLVIMIPALCPNYLLTANSTGYLLK